MSLSSRFRQLSSRIHVDRSTASERLAHDEAMLDRGVADDHAASITRALSSGHAGCKFCA